MKTLSLITALSSAGIAAGAVVLNQRSEPTGFQLEGFDPYAHGFKPKKLWAKEEPPNVMQSLVPPAQQALEGLLRNPGMMLAFNGPHKNDPPFVPRKEKLKPLLRPDAIREKLYFGPYDLPSSKAKNYASIFLGDSGMIQVFRKTTGPCTDCTILFGEAGLEFPNGTQANTDMGGWLHHSILLALGPDRQFAGCGNDKPMPGMDAFFGGGNERLPVHYTNKNASYDAGYYVSPKDTYMAYFELMNMNIEGKKVIPTITFEYLPGKPKNFKRIQDVWIDLDYCSPTGMPPVNDKAFSVNSTAWTSPYSGTIVQVDGHMHDGGTSLQIFQNGVEICDAVASYGQSPGFIERSNGIQGENGMQHISEMKNCEKMTRVEKGDKFHVKANYDFTKHMGEKNNRGKLGEIMGLTVMFFAIDE